MLTKCFVAAVWLHAAERKSLAFSKGKLFSKVVCEKWPLQNNKVQNLSQFDISYSLINSSLLFQKN